MSTCEEAQLWRPAGSADRRCLAVADGHSAAGARGPDGGRLSRRRGVDSAATARPEHCRNGRRRSAAIRRGIRCGPSCSRTELLPYQLDGIAFAVGAGRAVLADDMGLGKTIQGVGVAELLAREAGDPQGAGRLPRLAQVAVAERNPALLRPRLPAGPRRRRRACAAVRQRLLLHDLQLRAGAARHPGRSSGSNWDLIILDEGQRIKNWEAKTARVIKGLRSPFALVLSGTPLENRLDELYSVVQFIDDRRLGPAFRFFHRHRVVDEKGKVLGYKNLDQLRAEPASRSCCAARATRCCSSCPRTTEIVRIPPTDEQAAELHDVHMQIVSQIAAQEVPHRNGPAAAAKGPADVPHGGRTARSWSTSRNRRYLQQAGTPRRAVRPAVRRSQIARPCCSPNGPRCST